MMGPVDHNPANHRINGILCTVRTQAIVLRCTLEEHTIRSTKVMAQIVGWSTANDRVSWL
jgi:hypothetical protein